MSAGVGIDYSREIKTPGVVKGRRLSWYQRVILDVWMEGGRYDLCEVAVKRNYEVRVIKRWLGMRWVQGYIEEELRRRGYGREEIECRLIREIEGEEEMRDGQRESLRILAKMRGLLSDSQTNVMIGQTFDVRQGNGER